jgi:predicted nucleotidyltransferase
MASSNFREVLRTLHYGSVEFVLVGGLAAVLSGVPVSTFDVDVVLAGNEENLRRLLALLDQPVGDAWQAGFLSQLAPQTVSLREGGPLDVLGTIGRGLTYEDLLPHTVEMEIGDGVRVRALDLATIIAVKEQLATEKDLAVLPLLRRTLEEKQRR